MTNGVRKKYSHAGPKTCYNQNVPLGRRVDHLHVSEGWRRLKDAAIEEGFVAIAYERKFGHHSRTYMFAKTMITTGDFNVVSDSQTHFVHTHSPLFATDHVSFCDDRRRCSRSVLLHSVRIMPLT